MQLNKILFFNLLVLGTLISISSFSWFAIWMGLEMNLLSFIPLIHKNNPLSCEAALKYFIIQALSSMIVIFSFSLSFLFSEYLTIQSIFSLLMSMAFMMKMGMAPLHFWFPEITEGLNWLNTLILLTWQKIAPSILLMYNSKFSLFILFVMLAGLLVSGIHSWNQASLKKIMAYSSINHMSWMLIPLVTSQSLWAVYFGIYSLMNASVIYFFMKFEVSTLSKLAIYLNSNKPMKIFFILSFLSLGGIPPFLGFFPKWLALKALINLNLLFLAAIMVILTLLMIYIYVRISLQTLMVLSVEKKTTPLSTPSFTFWISNFFNLAGLAILTLFFNYF